MKRFRSKYEVADCGCVKYRGSPESGDPPRVIVWCGTLTQDAADLRAAIATAEQVRAKLDTLPGDNADALAVSREVRTR